MLLLLLMGLDHLESVEVDGPLKDVLTTRSISWRQLQQLLAAARLQKADMTVGALQTFVYVVERLSVDPTLELSVKDVADGLDVSYASVARHCDVLCDGPKASGGLNWLTKRPGSRPKTKQLQLTRLGYGFLQTALLDSDKADWTSEQSQ